MIMAYRFLNPLRVPQSFLRGSLPPNIDNLSRGFNFLTADPFNLGATLGLAGAPAPMV